MEREQAFLIVRKYVQNIKLINHMLAVEAAMRFYAHKFNGEEKEWGITGLLHDFDWEIHPNAEEHPLKGEPILREYGIPENVIMAILSHGDHTGIPRTTLMAKSLYACDEITGLITAVALIRPSQSLYDLSYKSIKKKWNDRSFAAGANREMMEKGAQEIDIELWQHVSNVIDAMRSIAPEIDLAGNLTIKNG
jgi:predicted hydrolase (HD superfamily)